jgi:hypothetical protein
VEKSGKRHDPNVLRRYPLSRGPKSRAGRLQKKKLTTGIPAELVLTAEREEIYAKL